MDQNHLQNTMTNQPASDTPRTDEAERLLNLWIASDMEAQMRGSYNDRPAPPNGFDIARQIEAELTRLSAEREKDQLDRVKDFAGIIEIGKLIGMPDEDSRTVLEGVRDYVSGKGNNQVVESKKTTEALLRKLHDSESTLAERDRQLAEALDRITQLEDQLQVVKFDSAKDRTETTMPACPYCRGEIGVILTTVATEGKLKKDLADSQRQKEDLEEELSTLRLLYRSAMQSLRQSTQTEEKK